MRTRLSCNRPAHVSLFRVRITVTFACLVIVTVQRSLALSCMHDVTTRKTRRVFDFRDVTRCDAMLVKSPRWVTTMRSACVRASRERNALGASRMNFSEHLSSASCFFVAINRLVVSNLISLWIAFFVALKLYCSRRWLFRNQEFRSADCVRKFVGKSLI